jgi:hypothetical protein
MSLYDLEVGDPVVFTYSYGKRGPSQGTVVKKGRKLITVQPEGTDSEHLREVFRMEDGSLNSKDYSYHAHVYTVEEYEEWQRRGHLKDKLQDRGIQLSSPREVSTEVMEKLVQVLEEAEKGEA